MVIDQMEKLNRLAKITSTENITNNMHVNVTTERNKQSKRSKKCSKQDITELLTKRNFNTRLVTNRTLQQTDGNHQTNK